MDLRTRWLPIGTVAAMGLVVAATLPARPCDEQSDTLAAQILCPTRYHSSGSQAAAVHTTRARLEGALWRRTVADSLQRSRDGRRVTAGDITVMYERPLTADSARRYLALAQRELAMIPGSGRGQRVVIALFSDPARIRRDSLTNERWYLYRHAFERYAIGGPDGACFVVVGVDGRWGVNTTLRQQRPSLLDWCALYARFGAPGPDVRRWVRWGLRPGWRDQSSVAEMLEEASGTTPRDLDAFQVRACQAGSVSNCRVLMTQEGAVRDFLAWLLATRGADQFARFWRAPGSMDEAIASGFGRPAGETLGTWARSRFRAAPSRTMASRATVLAGAVWFALAMVAAFVALQRREVS